MFRIQTTKKFRSVYKELPEKTQGAVKNKVCLFCSNPRHPSLRTEKLEPKGRGFWSFRVNKKHKIIFQFRSSRIVLFWNITKHYQ